MSAINSISGDKLARLVGTPRCPSLIDIRSNDEFSSNPRLIPGSIRKTHSNVSEWAGEFAAQSAVVICSDGAALSQGTAAWLRHAGVTADVLEYGFEGWAKAALPLVTAGKMPLPDRHGRSVWVTRARPKVDRIACPWLIRRFIDPKAKFRWLKKPKDCPKTALGFDFDGAEFTHIGARVTFEVLAASFGLDNDRAITRLGALVHYLDVGGIAVPEAAGFAAIMAGARAQQTDDDKLLQSMSAVLDALYASYSELPGDES